MKTNESGTIERIAWIILCVVLVIGLFKMREVTYNGVQQEYEQFMADTVQHFEQIIDNDQVIIARQVQQVGSLEQAVQAGIVDIERLKKANIDHVNTIVSLKTQIRILAQELDYKPDSVFIYDTITVDGDTYLRVPMPFYSKPNKWYAIGGTVLDTGIVVDFLNINQEPTMLLGYKSQGYFKPTIPIVAYYDNNPWVTPMEMQNVTIYQPEPWYKSPWMRRLEGFLAGVGFVKGAQWISSK